MRRNSATRWFCARRSRSESDAELVGDIGHRGGPRRVEIAHLVGGDERLLLGAGHLARPKAVAGPERAGLSLVRILVGLHEAIQPEPVVVGSAERPEPVELLAVGEPAPLLPAARRSEHTVGDRPVVREQFQIRRRVAGRATAVAPRRPVGDDQRVVGYRVGVVERRLDRVSVAAHDPHDERRRPRRAPLDRLELDGCFGHVFRHVDQRQMLGGHPELCNQSHGGQRTDGQLALAEKQVFVVTVVGHFLFSTYFVLTESRGLSSTPDSKRKRGHATGDCYASLSCWIDSTI